MEGKIMESKHKELTPLVTQMRIKVKETSYGSGIYYADDIQGQEFDVIALGVHKYEDRSQTAVAFLDTPKGIREVALERLIVVSKK